MSVEDMQRRIDGVSTIRAGALRVCAKFASGDWRGEVDLEVPGLGRVSAPFRNLLAYTSVDTCFSLGDPACRRVVQRLLKTRDGLLPGLGGCSFQDPPIGLLGLV